MNCDICKDSIENECLNRYSFLLVIIEWRSKSDFSFFINRISIRHWFIFWWRSSKMTSKWKISFWKDFFSFFIIRWSTKWINHRLTFFFFFSFWKETKKGLYSFSSSIETGEIFLQASIFIDLTFCSCFVYFLRSTSLIGIFLNEISIYIFLIHNMVTSSDFSRSIQMKIIDVDWFFSIQFRDKKPSARNNLQSLKNEIDLVTTDDRLIWISSFKFHCRTNIKFLWLTFIEDMEPIQRWSEEKLFQWMTAYLLNLF